MKLPDRHTILNEYLFGIPLTDDFGTEYPTTAIDNWIARGVAWAESRIKIKIAPTQIVNEHHDYHIQEYQQFCYIQLYQFPVISVTSLKASYAGQDIMTFPSDWIQIYKESGQLQLVPTTGSLSQILLGQGSGVLLPLITMRLSEMPHLFSVDYVAGFGENDVPGDIVDIIAMRACIGILNVLGDILLGAGIASQSVSLDGISESIGTTQSAEYGAYSARCTMYQKEIKAMLPDLQAKYRGVSFTAA